MVSDECYLDLGWDAEPVSALHPDVCGGRHDGVVALHSLSKRSNLAGYRCGFVTGDAAVVAELALVRRNLGLQMPAPAAGRGRRRPRRRRPRRRPAGAVRRPPGRAPPALGRAGFRVDHSEAGLYLWATRDEPAATTVDRLADLGLLAVNGLEYGAAGSHHVRFALTVPDDAVAIAVERLDSWKAVP